MSNSFLQMGEIFQKLKDLDLDRILALNSKIDLKDLLDRISNMDDEQLNQVVEFIQKIPPIPHTN